MSLEAGRISTTGGTTELDSRRTTKLQGGSTQQLVTTDALGTNRQTLSDELLDVTPQTSVIPGCASSHKPVLWEGIRHSKVQYTLCDTQVDSNVWFRIPSRLTFIEKLGSGAYGTVAAFRDNTTKQVVAIKRIQNAFHDLIDGLRVLREIRILRQLNHNNVVRLTELLPPENLWFEDVYLVTQRMDSDLHHVIYSSQPLSPSHIKHFMKQILLGLQYVHARGITHRDLKPSNILVNASCDIKICDFGLARGTSPRYYDERSTASNVTSSTLTDYVVTRWYRPPEILLGLREYSTAVDLWSLGCVFGELFRREALFPGKNETDQLHRVLQFATGFEVNEAMAQLPSTELGRKARRMLSELQNPFVRIPFEDLVPKHTDVVALDLLKRLLSYYPDERPSAAEALMHPYFTSSCDSTNKDVLLAKSTTTPAKISWAFDAFTPTKRALQNRVYQDMALFHPWIIQRDVQDMSSVGLQRTASCFTDDNADPYALGHLRIVPDSNRYHSCSTQSFAFHQEYKGDAFSTSQRLSFKPLQRSSQKNTPLTLDSKPSTGYPPLRSSVMSNDRPWDLTSLTRSERTQAFIPCERHCVASTVFNPVNQQHLEPLDVSTSPFSSSDTSFVQGKLPNALLAETTLTSSVETRELAMVPITQASYPSSPVSSTNMGFKTPVSAERCLADALDLFLSSPATGTTISTATQSLSRSGSRLEEESPMSPSCVVVLSSPIARNSTPSLQKHRDLKYNFEPPWYNASSHGSSYFCALVRSPQNKQVENVQRKQKLHLESFPARQRETVASDIFLRNQKKNEDFTGWCVSQHVPRSHFNSSLKELFPDRTASTTHFGQTEMLRSDPSAFPLLINPIAPFPQRVDGYYPASNLHIDQQRNAVDYTQEVAQTTQLGSSGEMLHSREKSKCSVFLPSSTTTSTRDHAVSERASCIFYPATKPKLMLSNHV